MCPVEKTGAASELLTSPFLADPILQKKLNEQNLWEILINLPGEYSKQDILDFLRFRHSQLADLMQNYLTMSTPADVEEPQFDTTAEMNSKNAFSKEDQLGIAELFAKIFQTGTKQGQQKSAQVKGPEMPEEEGAGTAKYSMGAKLGVEKTKSTDPLPPPDDGFGAATIAEAEQFLEGMDDFVNVDFANKIFEAQCMMEYSSKNAELEKEVKEIIDKVKRGQIDAVWVLIAVAKVNCTRNGLLFSQYGKKLWRLNDMSTRLMNELLPGISAGNPADLHILQQKQKEFGFQQQFLVQDMQKLSNNIEQTMTFARTTIDEIFKTRLHIINAPFRGS